MTCPLHTSLAEYKNQWVSAPRGAGSLVAESATEKGPTQPISYRVLSR